MHNSNCRLNCSDQIGTGAFSHFAEPMLKFEGIAKGVSSLPKDQDSLRLIQRTRVLTSLVMPAHLSAFRDARNTYASVLANHWQAAASAETEVQMIGAFIKGKGGDALVYGRRKSTAY